MRLALFEPDIPQNAASLIRTAACLGVPVDLIEPCGFVLSDAGFRRAGLDYLDRAAVRRHRSWDAFVGARAPAAAPASGPRLILLTTKAATAYTGFAFRRTDTLLLGRESAGVPDQVHAAADARLVIPMAAGARALNVAIAGAIVLGEALRQTGGFPGEAVRAPAGEIAGAAAR